MNNKERLVNVGKAKNAIGEIWSDAGAGIDVEGQLSALLKIREHLDHAIKDVGDIRIVTYE